MPDFSEEHTPPVIRPCRHIRRWVNSLADESLHGPARWLAMWHISYCRQCQSALSALKLVRTHLQALRETSPPTLPVVLSDNRLTNLQAALDEVEKRHQN